MEYEFFSREELESSLQNLMDTTVLLRIFGAYEMAEYLYLNKFRASGNPHFFHISRVCRIIIKELNILEPDIVISSMLQDSLVISNEIDSEVIEYNYGSYSRFLIDTLTDEYRKQKQLEYQVEDLKDLGGPDGLLIRLAKCLDNLRYFDFDVLINPISYLNSIMFRYFKLGESSDNPNVQYLIAEIKKESNKIIG